MTYIFSCCYCRENVTFGLMSAEQMKKQSHIQIVNKGLYGQDGTSKHVPYGVLDHKMVCFNDYSQLMWHIYKPCEIH